MKLIKLVGIMMVASVGTLWAQAPQEPPTAGPSCCPMMGRGEHLMEWHQKALEKFKEQNAELDRLVQAMNAAKGPAKIDAMEAVINKAMEQRKAWQTDMEEHHQKMMEWMKKHPMKSGSGAVPPPEEKP
ncbi:MAG: hypothetical protein ACFUZC_07195 [Chthoniobacteraceae bacterium]